MFESLTLLFFFNLQPVFQIYYKQIYYTGLVDMLGGLKRQMSGNV